MVDGAYCPNQNDLKKISVLGFNLNSNFTNTVHQWCTLNILDYDVLNSSVSIIFLFCTQSETKTAKNQDKAQTTSFKYIYTGPYPSPHNQRH